MVPDCDLIIDGLLGFSTTSAPTGSTADLIRATNASGTPILAIDVPSGLQSSTGEVFEPTIRATNTITLGLPKTGLLPDVARPVIGELWIADIGIPLAAYAAAGISVDPFFSREEFIRI